MLPRKIERWVFGFFAVLPILALIICPLTDNFRHIPSDEHGFSYNGYSNYSDSSFDSLFSSTKVIDFRFLSGGEIFDRIQIYSAGTDPRIEYGKRISPNNYSWTQVYMVSRWTANYNSFIPLSPVPTEIDSYFIRSVDPAYHSIELIVPLIPSFAFIASINLSDALGVSSLFAIIVAWVITCFMLQMIIEALMCVPRMCAFFTAKMLNRHYKEGDVV